MVRGGHDWAADALTASPVDMANRAPPVKKPTATGRTCAKRMIMPLPALFVTTAERLFSMEWLHQACNAPPRLVRPPLDTMLSARRYSQHDPVPRLPVASRLITMSARCTGSRTISPYYWDDLEPLAGSMRIGGTARHVC